MIYEGTREVQVQLAAEYALGYRQDRPVAHPLPAWPDEGEPRVPAERPAP
jgi:glutaryl-CoA dehydrogenase (non-decarboxylating)